MNIMYSIYQGFHVYIRHVMSCDGNMMPNPKTSRWLGGGGGKSNNLPKGTLTWWTP